MGHANRRGRNEALETAGDAARQAKRLLGRLTLIVGFVVLNVALFQYGKFELEIVSAQASFKNLIAEYHMHGEEQFRRRMVYELAKDGFVIDPDDILIERDDASGSVSIEFTELRELEVLSVYLLERTVVFSKDTSLSLTQLE